MNTVTQTTKGNKLYLCLDIPDRSKTQLAYAANYFPTNELSDAAKNLISWSTKKQLYKSMIVAGLTEDMTQLRYAPYNKPAQLWAIHWRYNNIPTQIEWERKNAGYIIEAEFRVIADGTKIVLLSF